MQMHCDYTDGVLSLPSQLEVSENVDNGRLEICTSLSTGGTVEATFVVMLIAVDGSAGEKFYTLVCMGDTSGSLHLPVL